MSLFRVGRYEEDRVREFWPLVTQARIGPHVTHTPWRQDPDCKATTPFYYSREAIHIPTNYQIVVL